MTSGETQIQILRVGQCHKRVPPSNEQNPECHVVVVVAREWTGRNCPAEDTWPNHLRNEQHIYGYWKSRLRQLKQKMAYLCCSSQVVSGTFKAETHDATNRCDTSPRQVAATNRLVWHEKIIVAATEFVAAICRANSNWFEFVRHIVAIKQGQATCRSNSADEATCRSDVCAAICRIVCLGL